MNLRNITIDKINNIKAYNMCTNAMLFDCNVESLDTLKEIIDYVKNNESNLNNNNSTKIQTNCPNCGAAIKSEVCEYCETNLKLIGVI